MSNAHSIAATPAPARVARAAGDEALARDSLWAHARRSLRATEGEVAAWLLTPLIGLLLRLRTWAGGAPDPGAQAVGDGPGQRTQRLAGRPHAAVHPAKAGGEEGAEEGEGEGKDEDDEDGAPRHERRLFNFLVYLCILLVGGMAGGALAYNLLENLLASKSSETLRMGATIEKQAKSIIATVEKLEKAQAKVVEAEKKLAESGITATEKKLAEAQAGRIDVEKKLEATLAESAKVAAEKQKRLDEAVKTLGTIIAAERAGKAQRPGSRGSADSGDTGGSANGKAPAPKAGDCTLSPGNVAAALKDCVADFKR